MKLSKRFSVCAIATPLAIALPAIISSLLTNLSTSAVAAPAESPAVNILLPLSSSTIHPDIQQLGLPSATPQTNANDSTTDVFIDSTTTIIGQTTAQRLARSDRSNTDPTTFWWLHGVSANQIKERLDDGYRLVDLEVESTSPHRFSVALVKNEGSYAKTWWWYYGISSNTLREKLADHNARITDLQVYRVNGQKRYAVILKPNTGTNAKAWWYYTDQTFDRLMQKVDDNNARLVDIDTYVINGERRFSGVMIRNTGADRKSWWVYSNKSPSFIRSKLQEHNARLIDIERRGNAYTVLMEQSEGQGWWWYHGQTAAQVNERWRQNGARIFDIEPYTVNGQKRFAVLMLDNSNSLTRRIRQLLSRSRSGGAYGLYLKRTNGEVLASLQSDRVFYPASTIKVLEHLHAMRAVTSGMNLDTTSLTVYPNENDSCQDDHRRQPFETETLRQALRNMMKHSNNHSTNAIQELFGNGNAISGRQMINHTAHQIVGMSNATAINHKFGCDGPNNNPANRLTLEDITLLYQQAAVNTNVLSANQRATFYDLMPNQLGQINTVIDEEADKLNLSPNVVQTFKQEVRTAAKAGSYTLTRNSQTQKYRSIGGWVRLPFKTNQSTTHKEYVFGLFIDQAETIDLNIQDTRAELLRDEIQAALRTFQ